MSPIFSPEGWKALRASWLVLGAAILAGGAIVYGSYWYGTKETRDSANASRRLLEARTRLDNARRERESLNESAEVFRTLVDRGLLEREKRLDLVELVNSLRSRYQLFTLDYEIAPQRTLPLAGVRVYPAIDILASRVKLRARGLHEGDVLGFLDELTRSQRGFYPVDRCTLRRLETPPTAIQPHVEADCSLEWITLKDKVGHRAG
ncbi:MAG TPA: hypothetical protein VEG27_14750 [Usitatibacter sp.]|nr:hypothetical protein [Usitatibacter sp.]